MRSADPSRRVIPGPIILKSPNPCWKFLQGRYCPEELCHYQHGPRLVLNRRGNRGSPSRYGPTACVYFAKGFCKNGTSCNFAHITPPSIIRGSYPIGELQGSVDCAVPQAPYPYPSPPFDEMGIPEVSSGAMTHPYTGSNSPGQFSLHEQPLLLATSKPTVVERQPDSASPQPHPDSLTADVEVASDSTGTVTPFILAKDSPTPPRILPDQVKSTSPTPAHDSNAIVIGMDITSIWDEVGSLDEEDFVSRHTPYIDRNHHAPQVYDDKTVRVLSGGVLLGIPGTSEQPPPPPTISEVSSHPVQIPPLSKSSSVASVPSLIVSCEGSSVKNDDADTLYSPLDWDSGAQSPAVWRDGDAQGSSISDGCNCTEDMGADMSHTSRASPFAGKPLYRFPEALDYSVDASHQGPNSSSNGKQPSSSQILPLSLTPTPQKTSRRQRAKMARELVELATGAEAIQPQECSRITLANDATETDSCPSASHVESIIDARRRSSSFVEAGVDASALKLLTRKEKELLNSQGMHRRVPSI
ncbi:uncharacterized protein EI90DRAFT_3015184 [Cantharellus anzutake]|uniref:uncharacterized protein n=1 Tax=Cantharellus anzutake TaxID=1750568 RepID=UPI001908FE88|nr:uncharacterized protein EI90DRAFT_3015184 [Cantharellus anzutake]KAF8334152.1 hypothetical protein EI90DRAFT_3015184 [Cantharellus anzutake]